MHAGCVFKLTRKGFQLHALQYGEEAHWILKHCKIYTFDIETDGLNSQIK